MPPTLELLVKEPFGPFLDSDIFDDEKCKSIKGQMLQLTSFMMEYAGRPIGLDESETPPERPRTSSIRFRGVLTIESLDWLSEKGIKYVSHELESRFKEQRLREGYSRIGNISLDKIYKKELVSSAVSSSSRAKGVSKVYKVKVLIQGEKGLPALFCSSHRVPHGLLWNSKDKNRQYEVVSMHVRTFSLSENFFWRYRLKKLMTTIVETDPAKTPVENRTADYFVEQYINRFAYDESARHRRIIFDLNDSDVNIAGYTNLPRHLRTVHKSEIYGIFAEQAEWIFADQVAMRQPILNVMEWRNFCKTVKRERKAARAAGISWGVREGAEVPDIEIDEDEDMADEREVENDVNMHTSEDENAVDKVVNSIPIIGRDLKQMHRALERKKRHALERRLNRSPRSPSPDPSENSDEVADDHSFDSDFSVAPSSAASTSSEDEEDELKKQANPDILKIIPREIFKEPQLPGPDFRWWCPVKGCKYVIDLLDLSDDNVRKLSGPAVRFLLGDWQYVEDGRVKKAFYDMVNTHYTDHCNDLDIRAVNLGKKNGNLEWIHPRRHPPWPHSARQEAS